MSNKTPSTITTKPAIDPALQWIGGSENPAAHPIQIVNKPSSKQADKLAKKQADKEEAEPTAMLSARVPASLIRKLRIRAATQERPIQEIVAELLSGYLDEN